MTNHVLWPTELKRQLLFGFIAMPSVTSAEKRCKGTTKNAHDQIFYEKNAFFCKKSAFWQEIYGHGLHFATVASGEWYRKQ